MKLSYSASSWAAGFGSQIFIGLTDFSEQESSELREVLEKASLEYLKAAEDIVSEQEYSDLREAIVEAKVEYQNVADGREDVIQIEFISNKQFIIKAQYEDDKKNRENISRFMQSDIFKNALRKVMKDSDPSVVVEELIQSIKNSERNVGSTLGAPIANTRSAQALVKGGLNFIGGTSNQGSLVSNEPVVDDRSNSLGKQPM